MHSTGIGSAPFPSRCWRTPRNSSRSFGCPPLFLQDSVCKNVRGDVRTSPMHWAASNLASPSAEMAILYSDMVATSADPSSAIAALRASSEAWVSVM
jgi:hypothetical protein